MSIWDIYVNSMMHYELFNWLWFNCFVLSLLFYFDQFVDTVFELCLEMFSLVQHSKSYLNIVCLNRLFLRQTINVRIFMGHDFNEHINMAIKFYATPNKNGIPKGIFSSCCKMWKIILFRKTMILIQHEDSHIWLIFFLFN